MRTSQSNQELLLVLITNQICIKFYPDPEHGFLIPLKNFEKAWGGSITGIISMFHQKYKEGQSHIRLLPPLCASKRQTQHKRYVWLTQKGVLQITEMYAKLNNDTILAIKHWAENFPMVQTQGGIL